MQPEINYTMVGQRIRTARLQKKSQSGRSRKSGRLF